MDTIPTDEEQATGLERREYEAMLAGNMVRNFIFIYILYTWPVKIKDSQRLHRNGMSMIRWMCGVTLKDRSEVRNSELV